MGWWRVRGQPAGRLQAQPGNNKSAASRKQGPTAMEGSGAFGAIQSRFNTVLKQANPDPCTPSKP